MRQREEYGELSQSFKVLKVLERKEQLKRSRFFFLNRYRRALEEKGGSDDENEFFHQEDLVA